MALTDPCSQPQVSKTLEAKLSRVLVAVKRKRIHEVLVRVFKDTFWALSKVH